MRNTRRWITGICLVAAATTQSLVYGQRPQGVIQGRVSDSSGAVIPGASVQVKGPSGLSRAVTTDAEGRYAADGLPAGGYSIQVEWPGFAPFESKPIEVSGNGPRVFDVRLQLSETRQQVTVEADGFEPVSTAPASNPSAIVLQGKDLDALPDDPDDLLSDLQAMAGPAVTSGGGELFVDGFSGGRLPPKESIREIRINQNPFSAEYDHPGFGRIEVFTKPGTDKFHGMASFKFSDAALESRNPFSTTRPPYQSRDFGGNVGGPLGRRASFFADVERRTIDESAIVNALVLEDSLNAIRLNQAIPNPRIHTTVSPRVFAIHSAPRRQATERRAPRVKEVLSILLLQLTVVVRSSLSPPPPCDFTHNVAAIGSIIWPRLCESCFFSVADLNWQGRLEA